MHTENFIAVRSSSIQQERIALVLAVYVNV